MADGVQFFTEADIGLTKDMLLWRKKTLTRAMRISGPFVTMTREGDVLCEDGYLAFDSGGYPYPIARNEFEQIYVLARDE